MTSRNLAPCGTYSAYTRGCHCDLCRESRRLYGAQHRKKKAEQRRIEAENRRFTQFEPLGLPEGDVSWMTSGACHGTGSEHFFASTDDESKALILCRSCPVKVECLRYALRTEQRFGVWGGTTAVERRNMRTPP